MLARLIRATMQDFSSKNILVVGASSGIGAALAQQLLASGASVYSASRTAPSLPGISAHFPLDASQFQPEALQGLPDVLHGVAYCPGTIVLKPFHRLSEAELLHDFRVNALGAAQVLQACLPRLKKAQGAGVVLFSTVAVQVGMGFHASVAMAKGAVEGLGKSLAAELAPSRIRVNVVAPSLTDTPLAGNLLATDEKREASAKRHPLGRIGTADELAGLAAFLLSDAAGWITGQVIGADGGMAGTRGI
jgi:NAD(P)-dependent dehydrogenase (short-subunit alcohol dehydrogenase family)